MSSWVHSCGMIGQTSRCFMVCSSPHSHVVCPSSLNPHFCIRDLHRPVPAQRRFRLDQVGHVSLEPGCSDSLGLNESLCGIVHQLHTFVSVNFLVTGHTKFGPDWCFGLIKQRYRREIVSCQNDLVDVVNDSTITDVNIAQKVGTEDGEIIVPQADWWAFLRPFFRVMPGIKRYHHFCFDSTQPGMLFRKEYADSEEESFCILQDPRQLPSAHRPPLMTPPGLDITRQNYLHDKIREFCTPHTRDITCPRPAVQQTAVQRPAEQQTTEQVALAVVAPKLDPVDKMASVARCAVVVDAGAVKRDCELVNLQQHSNQ